MTLTDPMRRRLGGAAGRRRSRWPSTRTCRTRSSTSGAAGLTDDGRIITGCNVENASYGLTLCAECALVSILHVTGGGRLVAVVTVGNGQPVMPCGRCRQLLWEHGGPDCLLDGDGTPQPMRDVLPGAFDASRMLPG